MMGRAATNAVAEVKDDKTYRCELVTSGGFAIDRLSMTSEELRVPLRAFTVITEHPG